MEECLHNKNISARLRILGYLAYRNRFGSTKTTQIALVTGINIIGAYKLLQKMASEGILVRKNFYTSEIEREKYTTEELKYYDEAEIRWKLKG